MIDTTRGGVCPSRSKQQCHQAGGDTHPLGDHQKRQFSCLPSRDTPPYDAGLPIRGAQAGILAGVGVIKVS